MKRPARLTTGFCQKVRAPGFYSDGSQGYGLRLRVATGGKSWVQSYRGADGKQRSRGLGAFPDVSLDMARFLAVTDAIIRRTGVDPRHGAEVAQEPVQALPDAPSFEDAAEEFIALARAGWKAVKGGSEDKYRATVHEVAFRHKPVNQITREDVRAEIVPIWSTKRTLASTRLTHIRRILDYADVEPNPAAGLRRKLPTNGNGVEHFEAIPVAEMPAAFRSLDTDHKRPQARRQNALVIQFAVLTASRPDMALGARWSEIDDDHVWTVPAKRMKGKRDHRIPLSGAALAVLAEARKLARGRGLIFPARNGGKIDKGTINRVMKRNGGGTVHGNARSTFRDWTSETDACPREVAEAALGHVVPGVEGAYARSDLLERRRPVMEAWGVYATGRAG